MLAGYTPSMWPPPLTAYMLFWLVLRLLLPLGVRLTLGFSAWDLPRRITSLLLHKNPKLRGASMPHVLARSRRVCWVLYLCPLLAEGILLLTVLHFLRATGGSIFPNARGPEPEQPRADPVQGARPPR